MHQGTPKGTIEKIGGYEAYFAHPTSKIGNSIAHFLGPSKNSVVIATDAFGHSFLNTQLIADNISSHTGALVVMPDLFEKKTLNPDVFIWPEEKRVPVCIIFFD